MNTPSKIKALAIAIIFLFGFGVISSFVGLLNVGISSPVSAPLFKGVATNLLFVIGGIGLVYLKRWGWWLTIGLSGIIIIQSTWHLLAAGVTNHFIKWGVVVGFYLVVTFLLTRNSVRKVFRNTGPERLMGC